MKVTIVIALARFYAQLPPGNTRTFTALWPALVMIGLPAGLVMLQPDLGTPLAISIAGLVVMFVAGLPLWWFVRTPAAGLAALPTLFSFPHDSPQTRLLTLLDRISSVGGKSVSVRVAKGGPLTIKNKK